jgi:phage/plasmid-associated DNA primase
MGNKEEVVISNVGNGIKDIKKNKIREHDPKDIFHRYKNIFVLILLGQNNG